MDLNAEALKLHAENQGKISVTSRVQIKDKHDLSLAYSPGVAAPCREIAKDPDKIWLYTGKGRTVAVITDGSAVLGLGDIGPEAALPVMEGKAALFKAFAGVDAFPICVGTQDIDEFVEIVKKISIVFGGINLEDIAAPRCFEIERRLIAELDIPVFHDDQHGTAIVTYAGLINALKVVGKELSEVTVVLNGPGAAGVAICKLLLSAGVGRLKVLDRAGLLTPQKDYRNPAKEELARLTNPEGQEGDLASALVGADVFIGVSSANLVTGEMVRQMAPDPIIFALANPDPEIDPAEAFAAGAKVVATGRSDYPNQINNVLGFPGIFKGALRVGASAITEEMKLSSAKAIAALVGSDLSADYIIPSPFDPRVASAVAFAVAEEAMRQGLAKRPVPLEELRKEFGIE
ncbi:MAG: NAD-dependent malic enzyme [Firmicutes bacterium]|nr:NAD-dependent malic enzyme [Bacillota bacterium]